MYKLILSILLFTLSPPALAQASEGARPPTEVFTTMVKQGQFADRIEALCTLKANESITLTATITDTVTAIHFNDGQRVEKGDVLIELTSNEESAALQEEQSTVNEARKQVERLRPLVKQGAAAQSLLDERRREYETAKARLEAVKSRLQDRIITAPFSGIVGLRNISVGALVQPGMEITTLDDDSVMKLDFPVPSLFLSSLKPGLPITAQARALDGMAFNGEVASIGSQVDPVTRSIMVRALIPNDSGVLRPGLLMSVNLFKNARETLILPEEALIQEGNSSYVFHIINNDENQTIVQKTDVKTGARRPGDIEILEGVSAGDEVVLHGTLKVSNGAKVLVKAVAKDNESLQELLEQVQ